MQSGIKATHDFLIDKIKENRQLNNQRYDYWQPSVINNSIAENKLFDANVRFPVNSRWTLRCFFELQNTMAATGNLKFQIGSFIGQTGNQGIATAANIKRCLLTMGIWIPDGQNLVYDLLLRIGSANSVNVINTGNAWDYTGSGFVAVPNSWEAIERSFSVSFAWITQSTACTTYRRGGYLIREQ